MPTIEVERVFELVSEDNDATLSVLLQSRPGLARAENKSQWKPLQVASYNGRTRTVPVLLKCLNPRTDFDDIIYSLDLARSKKHFRIANQLMRHLGRREHNPDADDDPLETALRGNLRESLKILIRTRSSFFHDIQKILWTEEDDKEPFETNELLNTTFKCQELWPLAVFLVNHGVNLSAEKQADTIFHSLVRTKRLGALRYFLRSVDQNRLELLNKTNKRGSNALHVAVESNFANGLRDIINAYGHKLEFNRKDKNGKTPLILSIESTRLDCLKILCQASTINKSAKRSFYNPLNSHDKIAFPLHLAVETDDVKIVETLLNSEVNFSIYKKNDEDKFAIELTQNDAIIEAIIKDRRFRPLENEIINGKTVLERYCETPMKSSILCPKLDFLDRGKHDIDSNELIRAATNAKNPYAVWIILKKKPTKLDFSTIQFFEALIEATNHDSIMKNNGENVLHVLARLGYYQAIYHFNANFKPSMIDKRNIHTQICSNKMSLYMQRNNEGNTPCMVAAKHNMCEALIALLQPIQALSGNHFDDDAKLHEVDQCQIGQHQTKDQHNHPLCHFVHIKNNLDQNLLCIISYHHKDLMLPLSIVTHMEYSAHGEDKDEILQCLHDNLGILAASAKEIVKIRSPGIVVSWCGWMFLQTCLLPLLLMMMDIVFDILLLREYRQEMAQEKDLQQDNDNFIKSCHKNRTLNCYAEVPSGSMKFYSSLGIFSLPYIFYLLEVGRYYSLFANRVGAKYQIESLSFKGRRNFFYFRLQQNVILKKVKRRRWSRYFGTIIGYIMVWLTWPVRVFCCHYWNSYKTETNHSSKRVETISQENEKFRIYSARTHLIEVITESSLQALLQLYLLRPELYLDLDFFANISLNTLTMEYFQLGKILWSIIGMSFSFTKQYRALSKLDLMPLISCAGIVYFISTFCFIAARLLAFQAFTYFWDPGEILLPFLFLLGHVILMSILHGWFNKRKLKDVRLLPTLHNCILNGLANIFVHNRIDLFTDQIWITSKSDSPTEHEDSEHPLRRTWRRQILFNVIFLLEMVFMLMLTYHSNVYQKIDKFRIILEDMVYIIGILFIFGVALRVFFYTQLHPWSNLICREILQWKAFKRVSQCWKRKDQLTKGDHDEESIELMLRKPEQAV